MRLFRYHTNGARSSYGLPEVDRSGGHFTHNCVFRFQCILSWLMANPHGTQLFSFPHTPLMDAAFTLACFFGYTSNGRGRRI